jgi:hypothetical protein
VHKDSLAVLVGESRLASEYFVRLPIWSEKSLQNISVYAHAAARVGSWNHFDPGSELGLDLAVSNMFSGSQEELDPRALNACHN